MAPKSYKGDEILKRYENLQHENDEETKDHTLQENAKERAKHPEHLNAGSPYDWEDVERYRKELERMDEEGPSDRKPV